MSRVWKKWSPYFHIIGWLLLMAFTVGQKYSGFEAEAETLHNHETRIVTLENNYSRIDQKLEDLISYWHIPHRAAQ